MTAKRAAKTSGFRIEHDSMGELQVPIDALWGAQTQRAVQNFPISGQPLPRGFIRALGLVKAAAAQVNADLGLLPAGIAASVRKAALDVAEGKHDPQFPIDVYQTGSGTSTNMNANEVIAALASRGKRIPVTRATQADVPELFTLQMACWVQEAKDNHTLDVPALHETLDDTRARIGAWDIYVLRQGGRLVGSVAGQLRGKQWEIGRLMVAPDQHGHGLGRQLLAFIQQVAPATATSFRLLTGAGSARNQRMYAQAGFELRGDLPRPPGTVVFTKMRSAPLAMRGKRTAGAAQVHPNDHVNMGQSSNDVIPTAIRVASQVAAMEDLLPAIKHLRAVIDRRARSFGNATKTGRTHLMDAMPLTFAQEFGAWSAQLTSAQARIVDTLKRVRRLPIGGTAIGTGINADRRFGRAMAKALTSLTKTKFEAAGNKFEGLAAQDDLVELSGQLNALAVALMKIANDLRWMNSGPLAGLGEIELPALQPGSSIMPGKVNPVIPEATCMVCAQVMGHHQAISIAGQSGNFQLNVMLPLVAANLLDSIGLLSNVMRLVADASIAGLTLRKDVVAAALDRNPILVTALNPVIGYEKAAAIAKRAYKEGRPVFDVALEDSGLPAAELRKLLDPAALTRGGIKG